MSPPSSVPAPAAALPTPLSAEQGRLLERLTGELDSAGLWWLSGYAAGLARAPVAAPVAHPVPSPAADVQPATVLWGSQTGNARKVAEALAALIEREGLPVRLLGADAYPQRELARERQLYVVISTQGDGDPPDDARPLVEFITGRRAPKLPQLQYAVLGLGDSSYPRFCSVGRQLDARLAELGARRLLDRADADLDIDTVAAPWLDRALDTAREQLKAEAPRATVTPLRPMPGTAPRGTFDRSRPFAAELLANQRITGRGSDRDVRHVELSLEGSGLTYEPGDALGVWPRNAAALVDSVLAVLGLDGDAATAHGGDTRPLREWLADRRELTRLSRPFLVDHARRARDPSLDRLLAAENGAALAEWLGRRQLPDLLRAYPGEWTGAELVAALRPLAPRLYSIASSRSAVGEEAHLTVAHVEYERDGDTRWGVASHFLAEAGEGARLPVFIEHNERFRLPADGTRDIIMIGPGTGVAPFRGFMQERAATGAGGRNWLVFGNPRFRSDFLYQLEWQRALRDGRLQRLDLAFSRDGDTKIHVQHRLREQGRELYAWLEGGAHLYVCGATRMARDVHAALVEIIARHGHGSPADAGEYLDTLRQQRRYARDVY